MRQELSKQPILGMRDKKQQTETGTGWMGRMIYHKTDFLRAETINKSMYVNIK